jgi:protein arginine N-methyltransferase 1
MLADEARFTAYAEAMMASVQPGDVVLDIGTGAGVLAHLACFAGASRVYAVEQGAVIDLARELSRENGLDDRVTFLDGWSTDIDLPEQVDVIATETVGNAAFDEGIAGWVIDARKRFLRPGGVVVPRALRLITAGIESIQDHAEVAGWSQVSGGLNYSVAQERAANNLWWVDLSPVHVLTKPVLVTEVELLDLVSTEVSGRGTLRAKRDGTLHGLGCWFEADLGHGISLSNAPPTPVPSWSQAFLPMAAPIPVTAGEEINWETRVSDNGGDWEWRVSTRDGEGGRQHTTADGRLGSQKHTDKETG